MIGIHSHFHSLEVVLSSVCVVEEVRCLEGRQKKGGGRCLSPSSAGLCLLLRVRTERAVVGATREDAGDRGSPSCISPCWRGRRGHCRLLAGDGDCNRLH